jgi:hypothetical protein
MHAKLCRVRAALRVGGGSEDVCPSGRALWVLCCVLKVCPVLNECGPGSSFSFAGCYLKAQAPWTDQIYRGV